MHIFKKNTQKTHSVNCQWRDTEKLKEDKHEEKWDMTQARIEPCEAHAQLTPP